MTSKRHALFDENVNLIFRTLIIAVLILITILIISFAFVIGFFYVTASDNTKSVYIYELQLSTSGPVNNATLLIPVPSYYNSKSGKNETLINMSLVSFKNFDRDNISAKIEDVKGVPMLKISADRITPVYKNRIQPIAIMPGQNESELPPVPPHIYSDRYSEETPQLVKMELHLYSISAGDEIDTRMPLGKEPLFVPCRILEDVSTSDDRMYENYYLSKGSFRYLFEVPFILSYDSGDENVLTVSSDFQGINQWWVLGWQSNSYSERIRYEFKGGCNGTYPVKGLLITGDGVY